MTSSLEYLNLVSFIFVHRMPILHPDHFGDAVLSELSMLDYDRDIINVVATKLNRLSLSYAVSIS